MITKNKLPDKPLTRLIALLLAFTVFTPMSAQAGTYVIGATGNPGSSGTQLNKDNTGLIAQWEQSFRVGLSRDPLGAPLTAADTPGTLKSRLEAQYSKRYPNNGYRADNWPITFLPQGHTQTANMYNNGVRYTEYDPASGELIAFDDPNVAANTMICSPTKLGGGTGVYYNNLKSQLGGSKKMSDLLTHWRGMAWNWEQSRNYWSYILQPQGSGNNITYLVNERAKEKLNPNKIDLLSPTLSESDRIDAALRYVDMLMTLYTLCTPAVRYVWETAIDDFLKGEVMGERPVYLIIDVVHTVMQGRNSPIYITSSIDFLQYHTGVDAYNNMLSNNFNGASSAFVAGQTGTGGVSKSVTGWFKQAVDGSVNNKNNMNRLSGQPKINTGNGWDWGVSAIVHHGRPSNRANNGEGGLLNFYYWQWLSAGMQALWFPSEGVVPGFNIIGSEFSELAKKTVPVDIKFRIKADPKDKEVTGPIGERATLGENAIVEVDLTQNAATIENWKKRLADVQTVDVIMSLIQTPEKRGLFCMTDSRFSGAAVNGSTRVTMSVSDFMKLLTQRLMFEDRVSDVTIGSEESIVYTYTLSMRAEFKDGSETAVISAISEENASTEISDYASFFRPKDPPIPEYIRYTSIPETPYSEIKQGRIGNERWEAMAGVPTTRDLYFAVGGSEFIVDMFGELKKEQKAQRTYHVHYSGIECEFKDPDNSKTHTLGGVTVNTHTGGSYVAAQTWSGNHSHTQNPQSCGTCGASGYNACTVNTSAYNTALAAANAYAAQINGTVLTWTAGSDKKTRTHSGWGANSVTTANDTASNAKTASGGSGCLHGGCSATGSAENPHSHSGGNCSSGSACSSSHAWAIEVRFSVTAHIICGPCCEHDLPAINDTWTQEIEYDYFQIQKATVWKLDQGHLNGLRIITGADDTVTARVAQGDPTIFYNIAQTETSRHGRFRYSIEPQQHDAVYWNKGQRTNKCNKQSEVWGTGILFDNNAFPHEDGFLQGNTTDKDKLTAEYAEFLRNRETLVEATVISDYLILQTSSGDQSVLYFDKKSNIVQTQQDYDHVTTTLDEGWNDNPNSAAKWATNHINTGSYNGNFANETAKYRGRGNGARVATIFDNDPAKTVTRTARPSLPLHIVKYDIDIRDTNPNGEYMTGTARAFWRVILDHNPDSRPQPFSVAAQPLFGNARGHVLIAPYSPSHTKINNILVHNPVSVEYSMVLPLAASRDQRIEPQRGLAVQLARKENSKCPRNPAECEFRILNCKYAGTNYHTANCYTATTPKTLNAHDHTVSCIDPAKIQEAFKPIPGIATFNFTGGVQTFTAPRTGIYTFELWGAQGGTSGYGGKGGYAKGTYPLTKGQTINIYVGGQTGWNGGGSGHGRAADSGGGGTDIRIGGTALAYRVIVAGGGGGFGGGTTAGGAGGGINGAAGTKRYGDPGQGGTQSAGGSGGNNNGGSGTLGQGGSNITGANSGGGGGGGGYYGGGAGGNDYPQYDDPDDSGGGGGSGYIGGVSNGTMQAGVREGNGYAVITYDGGLTGELWGLVDMQEIVSGTSYIVTNQWIAKQPNNAPIFKCGGMPFTRHICNSACSHTAVLVCNEPHHRGEHYEVSSTVCWNACNNDSNHANKTTAPANGAAAGSTAGDFVNLDWGFQIYYPNIGDFYQGEPYGLSALTAQRGRGFVNNMNTTEWIAHKRVRFMFDVIYCGATTQLNVNGSQHGNSANGGNNHSHTSSCRLYRAGSWIDLTPYKEYELYNFYAVSANPESAASMVTFEVVAINAPGLLNDNTEATNRLRDRSLRARHGAIKRTYIDVVGRIGNLVMEDTGDFRFSNLFKTPVTGDDWFIQGIVKKVDINSKNYVLSTLPDIRGLSTAYGQNTYGLLPWLNDGKNLPFSLSPDKNNIQALKNQPISFGYPVYLDLNTLGKDYANIEVIPHYYHFNLDTGQLSPLDVYMAVSATEYEAINRFGIVRPGWNQSAVFPYRYTLNWTEESGRRNVSTAEATLTQNIVNASVRNLVDDDLITESTAPMDAPAGTLYTLGTAQILSFGEKARTFIGSTRTMGVNQNLGSVLPVIEFEKAAKRWHFLLGLPSSAVVIDAGAVLNDVNIAKYKNTNGVILMTADIRATSDKFTLEYKLPSNGTFSMGGRSYSLPGNIPNVIAVYNGNRSSKDDLMIRRTH